MLKYVDRELKREVRLKLDEVKIKALEEINMTIEKLSKEKRRVRIPKGSYSIVIYHSSEDTTIIQDTNLDKCWQDLVLFTNERCESTKNMQVSRSTMNVQLKNRNLDLNKKPESTKNLSKNSKICLNSKDSAIANSYKCLEEIFVTVILEESYIDNQKNIISDKSATISKIYSKKDLVYLNPFQRLWSFAPSINKEKAETTDLRKLQSLAIEKCVCNFEDLSSFNGFIGGRKRFHELELRGNQLYSAPKFFDPSQIYELNLSENQISSFENIYPNLHRLNISKNKLKSIQTNVELSKLVSIDLSYNFVEDVSDLLQKSNFLIHFNCSRNNIKSLDCLPRGQKYSRLRVLNASFNEIHSVQNLKNAIFLEDINLSYNKISNCDQSLCLPFLKSGIFTNACTDGLKILVISGLKSAGISNDKMELSFCPLDFQYITNEKIKRSIVNGNQLNTIVNYSIQKVSNKFKRQFYCGAGEYLKYILSVVNDKRDNGDKSSLMSIVNKNQFEIQSEKRLSIFEKLVDLKSNIVKEKLNTRKRELRSSNMRDFVDKISLFYFKKKLRKTIEYIKNYGDGKYTRLLFLQNFLRKWINQRRIIKKIPLVEEKASSISDEEVLGEILDEVDFEEFSNFESKIMNFQKIHILPKEYDTNMEVIVEENFEAENSQLCEEKEQVDEMHTPQTKTVMIDELVGSNQTDSENQRIKQSHIFDKSNATLKFKINKISLSSSRRISTDMDNNENIESSNILQPVRVRTKEKKLKVSL
jgi:hypothetical protein